MKQAPAQRAQSLILTGIALITSACSGGHSGPAPTYTVGGSVSGLQGSGLVLEDNAGNDLSVISSGSFTFTSAIAAGGAYSVTVKTQPTNAWQTCAVGAGSGVVTGNVTSVVVSCVTNTYSVGGAVSGLAGTGLVVENNAADDLDVKASGSFTFPTPVASGQNYAVTVKTQPTSPTQTCTPSMASGTIAGAPVTNVAIACTTTAYSVGGSVSGLIGSGLVLQDNGGDNLTISGNGNFNFTSHVASGMPYRVAVLTQPGNPVQVCTVSGASGTVTNANVTTVTVTCAAPVAQCGQPNGTIVQHSSNVLANETWAGAGTTHIVTSTIAVMAPATLTIQKCALVQLKAGVKIVVQGDTSAGTNATLLVAGDDATTGLVYFMSADAGQAWGALEGYNANSLIELNFATLSGGGGTSAGTRNATIEMHGTSNTALPDPVLKVNNVTIGNMQGTAVYFDNAAFMPQSQALTINACPDYILAMSAMALGSVPNDGTSYTVGGLNNVHAEILVVGNANIFADLTIYGAIPVHFHTTGIRVAGGPPAFAPTVTLTIQPGATIRFENVGSTPTMMTFGTNGQVHDQNGVLLAKGTPDAPIEFTSGLDSPTPADYWAGIWLLTANGSKLSGVIFRFAGADAGIGPVNCGPYDPSINQPARHTAPLLVGDGTDQQYIPPADLLTNIGFSYDIGNFSVDAVWENTTRVFGPNLLTNANPIFFNATPKFCQQSKNLIPLGCTINGVDESGCQP